MNIGVILVQRRARGPACRWTRVSGCLAGSIGDHRVVQARNQLEALGELPLEP
ncbi:hypothetical protein [Streptomyces pratensis]|uniref:hypothetical protein n=1 Tax=Streptomyces pratensis TaxID=1169025 RepID=UPI00362EB97D